MQRTCLALESMSTSRWCGGTIAGITLRDHDLLPNGVPSDGCCWSGTLAADDDPPLVWLARGWEQFRTLLGGGGECLIRPRTDHLLSDLPSARVFVTELSTDDIGLALGPASMLTPDMLVDAEDHLTRIFEGLGASARLVLLEDLDETGRPVPLGEGVLPGPLIGSLIASQTDGLVPVGGLARQDEQVLQWLGGPSSVQ